METPNTIPIEILPSILLLVRAAAENPALLATPSQHAVEGYTHTLQTYSQRVNAPPKVTGTVKLLQECHETDVDQREAQFAFRSTDLQIWKEYFASRRESEFTDMDPVFSQHWSLAVRFLERQGDQLSKKIYFFEAVEDKSGVDESSEVKGILGILQPLCTMNVDDEVFERAEHFGTVTISPCELLEKANQVPLNFTTYNGLHNNCQSWVKQFLSIISPKLLDDLIKKLSSPVYSTRNIHRFLINAIQNAVANHSTNTAVNIVKLNECEEEFDQTKRDAQFAYQLRSISADGDRTDPLLLPGVNNQWTLLIHFSRGKKTYLFGAWKDENGKLQAGRAENVDYQIFQSAKRFGSTFITSPSELLDKAKQVPSNGTAYDATSNDSQSWLHEFLTLISPDLLSSLFEKESSIAAATITDN